MELYDKHRDQLRNGDIILCHSNTMLAKSIQLVDKSYWHHCEIIYRIGNRVFAIGAHPNESRIDFVSQRIKKMGWTDMMILQPRFHRVTIDKAIIKTLEHSEQFGSYDIPMLLRVLLYQTMNIDAPFLDSEGKDICSELCLYYLQNLGDPNFDKSNFKRPFFTPGDIERYASKNDYRFIR